MAISFRLATAVIRLLFLLLLSLHTTLGAKGFEPFVGRVPASELAADGLEGGYRLALLQVLGKLSGYPLQVEALAEAGELGPVAPLVMVHRFVDRGAGELRERWLEVQFDSTLTNDRLRDLGLPVWPLERPATLVWVAVERDGQRDLLGLADSDGVLLDMMVEDAAAVGVPLLLPLMDLQDQQLASISDVWGGFADQLRPASERYGARQLLLGRSYLSGGTWTTRWLLSGMARSQRWETRGTTLESTLSAGMGRLAAAMAAEAAIRPDEFSGRLLRIRVHGVSSARGYGTVMQYLTGLSVVDRLEPVSVFGEYLDLNLSSNVGLRGFQQALAAGDVLRARAHSGSAVDLELELQGL
ncbi:MAG: DUF2066 domain-containing protein [Pseudomonadota bacterium]